MSQEIKSKCTCDINGAEDDIGHFAGCPADTLSRPADTSAPKAFKNKYGEIPVGTLVAFEVENQSIWSGDLQGTLIFLDGEFKISTKRSGILEIGKYLSVYVNTIRPITPTPTPSVAEKKCPCDKCADFGQGLFMKCLSEAEKKDDLSFPCGTGTGTSPAPSDQKDWREELADLSEKHCKHDDNELYSCLYHIFEPFISKVEAEAEERGKAEIQQKWDGDKFVYYRDRVRFAINEARHELLEKIKNTPIEKAHTYASENADIYRAYDNGQENYKQIILKIFAQEQEKDKQNTD